MTSCHQGTYSQETAQLQFFDLGFKQCQRTLRTVSIMLCLGYASTGSFVLFVRTISVNSLVVTKLSMRFPCFSLKVLDKNESVTVFPSQKEIGGFKSARRLESRIGDRNVWIFSSHVHPMTWMYCRQARNLEKAFGDDVRVCDRTALILDIFSQRAATREATLQVISHSILV